MAMLRDAGNHLFDGDVIDRLGIGPTDLIPAATRSPVGGDSNSAMAAMIVNQAQSMGRAV